MQYISFILFALQATTKAFIDTIVFRSGQSIFPATWSPFQTYSTTRLFLGLVRLDPYHIAMYIFIALIMGSVMTYHPLFGLWDIALFSVIWGIFFEVPWRLFKK
jgi:hypothetical protein